MALVKVLFLFTLIDTISRTEAGGRTIHQPVHLGTNVYIPGPNGQMRALGPNELHLAAEAKIGLPGVKSLHDMPTIKTGEGIDIPFAGGSLGSGGGGVRVIEVGSGNGLNFVGGPSSYGNNVPSVVHIPPSAVQVEKAPQAASAGTVVAIEGGAPLKAAATTRVLPVIEQFTEGRNKHASTQVFQYGPQFSFEIPDAKPGAVVSVASAPSTVEISGVAVAASAPDSGFGAASGLAGGFAGPEVGFGQNKGVPADFSTIPVSADFSPSTGSFTSAPPGAFNDFGPGPIGVPGPIDGPGLDGPAFRGDFGGPIAPSAALNAGGFPDSNFGGWGDGPAPGPGWGPGMGFEGGWGQDGGFGPAAGGQGGGFDPAAGGQGGGFGPAAGGLGGGFGPAAGGQGGGFDPAARGQGGGFSPVAGGQGAGFGGQGWGPAAWGQGQGWAQGAWGAGGAAPGWGQAGWGQAGPWPVANGVPNQAAFNQQFGNTNFAAAGPLPSLENINSPENFQSRFLPDGGAGAVLSNAGGSAPAAVDTVDSIKPILPADIGKSPVLLDKA